MLDDPIRDSVIRWMAGVFFSVSLYGCAFHRNQAIGCLSWESSFFTSAASDKEMKIHNLAHEGKCNPLESGAKQAPYYKPALPGQTGSCAVKTSRGFIVETLVRGLEKPWAVAALPEGMLLVTEKVGRMRLVSSKGHISPPIAGLPQVDAQGEGGLLDVVPSPDFVSDRMLYWSFTQRKDGNSGIQVAKGRLSHDGSKLSQIKTVLHTHPVYHNHQHFGSRLAFGPDRMLYITLGERFDRGMRKHAQQMDSHLGKTLRIKPDGSVANDNPFAAKPGISKEIWSFGHRNVQAAAFDQKGQLWQAEHGPRGGDELNLIEKGRNYGWPLASYGVEYSGEPIAGASPERAGTEQPVYYWDPAIAPSGAVFYSGHLFPEWKNNLFVGALKGQRLIRLVIEDNKVIGEEHLLADRRQRIRDVGQGLDGTLYVLSEDGELLRLRPEK